MGKDSKYYKLGENLGKSIGKKIGAGTIALIVIGCIFIVLATMLVLYAIEALILWGLGSLVIGLIGINTTITFGQCFGVVILIDVLASIIKLFFHNKCKG